MKIKIPFINIKVRLNRSGMRVRLPGVPPTPETPPITYSPSLDFSIAENSQYIPVIF